MRQTRSLDDNFCWDLAWSLDLPFCGIPLYSYYRYLEVTLTGGPKRHVDYSFMGLPENNLEKQLLALPESRWFGVYAFGFRVQGLGFRV